MFSRPQDYTDLHERTIIGFDSINYEISITNYELNVAFDLHAPFEKFTGIKIFFFDFDGYHEFLTKILLDYYYTDLFSHVYRYFFFEFMNRAIISNIFEKKSNRKAFIVIWLI